jgi:hypothetical protein
MENVILPGSCCLTLVFPNNLLVGAAILTRPFNSTGVWN